MTSNQRERPPGKRIPSVPLAYLGGRYVPASEAAIPVDDAGFVLGATISEQLRTFGGKLFRLPQHLNRLARSLDIIGIDPDISLDELTRIANELVSHNHNLLEPGDDLGLAILVTPGPYATLADRRLSLRESTPFRGAKGDDYVAGSARQAASPPLVVLHTYPLPFTLWADKYDTGQVLVTTPIEQVSPRSWPPELKCRSRMHYFLADRLARQQEPDARALLLDENGVVTETATANIVVYRTGEGLISPPREDILPGISLEFIEELAGLLGIAFRQKPLTPGDLMTAEEVLLTSTPSCLLPVTRFNGRAIGSGVPGEAFRRMLAAWSEQVGVEIEAQARRFAAAEKQTPVLKTKSPTL